MENAFNIMSRTLLSVISPETLAFIEENHKKYTVKEFIESENLKNLIEPGDIVNFKNKFSKNI
jgi:hypothetical protein